VWAPLLRIAKLRGAFGNVARWKPTSVRFFSTIIRGQGVPNFACKGFRRAKDDVSGDSYESGHSRDDAKADHAKPFGVGHTASQIAMANAWQFVVDHILCD
jgi:hypothetical protein